MGLEYWVWLQQILGYGSRHLHRILDTFSDAQTAYQMRESDAMRALQLPVRAMQNIRSINLGDVIRLVKCCNARGIKIIPYNSLNYAQRLRQLENPPVVLYATGNLPDPSAFCGVAMVGTRYATEYGKRAAFSLSFRLASAGCVLISGIAGGIDKAVHLGAIAANVPTVAFLPCGHGQRYLHAKQDLLERILAGGGCLFSEWPPETVMPPNAFHLRNRLIAGMAETAVIVQAPMHSGALITAGYAAQQGKETFVVTGRPGDAAFAGSYALIKDGASPVFHARDILEALPAPFFPDMEKAFSKDVHLAALYNRAYPQTGKNAQIRNKTTPAVKNEDKTPAEKKKDLPAGISEAAAAVYRDFSPNGEYMDTLIAKTGLGSGRVLSAVTELEIYGLLQAAAGGKYVLV